MIIAIWCLVALNMIGIAWFAWRQQKLQADLRTAHQQITQWNAAAPPAAVAAAVVALGKPELISIEILNPLELALRESQLAKVFGSVAPDIVRREVYKEVHKRLCVQLQEQGVIAEVRLHHAA